jgi:hypothetical protein
MVLMTQSILPVLAQSSNALQEQCTERILTELHEERTVYRNVQYAATSAAQNKEADTSVLGTSVATTSDLVPYLVLNYHGLSCRLRLLCSAVNRSQGHVASGYCVESPEQSCGNDKDCDAGSCALSVEWPVGCARLFAVRGRWWSDARRNQVFTSRPIEECSYAVGRETISPPPLLVSAQCNAMAEQILQEERHMLRLLVAQDAAHRGTRRVAGIFQTVLFDIRNSFLEPLRGLADLFGSVLHPIPCLLSQCD